ISAIKALCSMGLYLEGGEIKRSGPIDDVVSHYFNLGISNMADGWISDRVPRQIATGQAKIRRVQILDTMNNVTTAVLTGHPLKILVRWEVLRELERGIIEIGIVTADGRQITQSMSSDDNARFIPTRVGVYEITLQIYDVVFPGRYSLLAGIHKQ